MKLLCVYSTLSSSVDYRSFKAGNNDMPVEVGNVHVKGGAGVANEHVQTPRGVATMITEAQAEQLRAHALFKLHEQNGFVMIDEVGPAGPDADSAAAVMEGRDESAPLVPQDYELAGEKPPVGNANPEGEAVAKVAVSGPGTAGRRNRK